MYQGIDTAAAIGAEAAEKLKREGISFVGRYLVPAEGATAWKALTREEARRIREAGLAILLIWETDGSRAKGGAAAGAADGAAALRLAREMGVPVGTVIAFAVDYDAPAADIPAIQAYFRAAGEQLFGSYLLGCYAPAAALEALREFCNWRWLCYAWAYGRHPDADAYQTAWQGDAAAKALAAKTGIAAVDLDEAKSLAGLWQPDKPQSEEETALAWAVENGIVDDSMRDVGQTALMLWRYHGKDLSGLLED